MHPALIALIVQVGAPFVNRILTQNIGARGAELAEDVLFRIAQDAGVSVDELGSFAESDPEIITAAITRVEEMAPELIAIYASGLDHQHALQLAELNKEHWFAWAWRPGWMVLLGFFWLWNIVILPLLNAVFKWALPPTDLTTLLGLTSLFMALYMGGHTIKDTIGKWKGAQ